MLIFLTGAPRVLKDVYWICTCRDISVLRFRGVPSEILVGTGHGRKKVDGFVYQTIHVCNRLPSYLTLGVPRSNPGRLFKDLGPISAFKT